MRADPSALWTPGQYRREALVVARELLGARLVADTGPRVEAFIVETEAYHQDERGAHCFGGRVTPRNAPMFSQGGRIYVYFIYGMHWALNVVTGAAGVGQAVLIRAVVPTPQVSPALIHDRRQFFRRKRPPHRRLLEDPTKWCDGPGKLCQALSIDGTMNDTMLDGHGPLWIERGARISEADVQRGPRVGIDYAGADAQLPWRFRITPDGTRRLLQTSRAQGEG